MHSGRENTEPKKTTIQSSTTIFLLVLTAPPIGEKKSRVDIIRPNPAFLCHRKELPTNDDHVYCPNMPFENKYYILPCCPTGIIEACLVLRVSQKVILAKLCVIPSFFFPA
ncbi:hypothetical protein NPIL_638521 [Nephila pilipes]|uniref:Uncharacterized protein n=1 Tax=Nephila pilipes TaxID=299642 RepID=A0A8X6MXX3_NEPPI|nr:hypothetical protein NPIL_638521 [Nephila pilipes]